MAILALVLALLAAVMHATWNFILKDSGDRLATVVSMSLGGAIVYAPWIYAVQGLPSGVVQPLAVSTVVHVLYSLALVAAYARTDFSVAYPIARGVAPALVALGGWIFLDDVLGWTAIGAVALIVAAIVAISWTPRSSRSLHAAGIRWALLTGLAISIYTIVDTAAVRESGAALSYTVTLIASSGGLLALVAMRTRNVRTMLAPLVDRPLAVGLAAVLNIGAYALVLFAATRAPVALVSAVRETSVVLGALAGVVLLGEPFGRRRLAGAAAVAVGIIGLGLL